MYFNRGQYQYNKYNNNNNNPKVFIQKHVWHKMNGWCRAAKSEVSGMFLVRHEKGNFHVYDIFFPKQKGSSGFTELDDVSVGKINYKLHKKGIDPAHNRGWWHTHYNFNVFWSGTDDRTAETMAKATDNWLLSIVINQAGEWLCRFDMYSPIEYHLDNLDIIIVKNEEKHKRKRNFRRDIRKWVKPYSGQDQEGTVQLTDLVKDKDFKPTETIIEEPKEVKQIGFVPRHTEHTGWEGWYDGFGRTAEDFISPPEQPSLPFEEPVDKPEPTLDTMIDAAKKYKSKYVIYGGKIIPIEKYEKEKNCPCLHVGDWEDCMCDVHCESCVDRLMEAQQNEWRNRN